MSFLDAKVIPVKPRLVFGEEGTREYFAVSFEKHLLGSMIHLHIRRVGEKAKDLEQRPVHTYLEGDAPDWARNLYNRDGIRKRKKVSK